MAGDANELDKVEIVNRAEEALLRTRGIARRMTERIWRTMESQALAGPHAPAPEVLIAEDEPVVRDLLGLMLEELGFRPLLAADGRQAVDLYRRHGDHIGVVLLDIHMPRLAGPEVLRLLRALDPRVGCIFITGDAGDYAEQGLLDLGAAAVLHKPFTPADLAAVLRPLVHDAGPDNA